MKINSELPDGTQCNLPDSAFKIELVMGAEAVFTRQYPVPQKILKKVCERAQEWVDNQWTVLLPGGEKNDWNSPILAESLCRFCGESFQQSSAKLSGGEV